MQFFSKIEALKAFLKEHRKQSKTVGLVPTMGALHPGHLQLVKTSRREADITVSSIYVNPTQFNSPKDLEKYPRTLERDTKLLEEAGCDAVFSPDNNEMYGRPSSIKFDFGHLDKVLEGEFRPGHFSGVALVVSKLFNIVQPDKAFFGQKDYQQFQVISRLVDELKFGLELRCIPTFRETDGLAMSSRNLRLNPDERKRAVILFKSLTAAKEALIRGEPWSKVKSDIRQWWNEPGLKLDYFEAADRQNLSVLDNVKVSDSPVLLIAGFVGEIRLIDNIIVEGL